MYNTHPMRECNLVVTVPKSARSRFGERNAITDGLIARIVNVARSLDRLPQQREIKMNILLIGCGKMGGAMLRQWVGIEAHQFTVADPAATDLPDEVTHVSKATDLPLGVFDVVLIAIKPQMIADVLPGYAPALKSGGCFVSIAAGCSVSTIARVVGDAAIVRVMPNMGAMVGLGVSGIYANEACTKTQLGDVTALIAHTGACVQLGSEDEIDRLTAVSGSGPGYIFEVMRSYVGAAQSLGFDLATARSLVFDTIAGAVETARQSEESLEDLRNSVTSKNGTTQAGLEQLMRDGKLDGLFQDTVQAAYARAGALK
jgi:pyrroline-5-carboxylate reductase